MASLRGVTVVVDNGEPMPGDFNIEVEQIDVTLGADTHKPDPSWSFVDSHGHYHAWSTEGTLPTTHLVEVPVDEDEAEEDPPADPAEPDDFGDWVDDEPIRERRCILCGDPVEPKTLVDIPGGTKQFMPGLTRYEVVVYGEVHAHGGGVSLRVETPASVYFGFGRVAWTNIAPKVDGATEVRTYLTCGPMVRQLDRPKVGAA